MTYISVLLSLQSITVDAADPGDVEGLHIDYSSQKVKTGKLWTCGQTNGYSAYRNADRLQFESLNIKQKG